jgi:hypothetical protein
MSNILYAKEILKNANNSNTHYESGQHMRVIRGLYVTGVWRPPHFIDRTLFVTNIGQNNESAKIESFTERSEDGHDTDYLTGLTSFTSTNFTFLKFSTNNENVKDKRYLENRGYLSGLTNMTTENITTTPYQLKQSVESPSGPPSLQIKSFGGTVATVTNVT